MTKDELHVVHCRATGLDVHKMQITASVRVCERGGESPRCESRSSGALPNA